MSEISLECIDSEIGELLPFHAEGVLSAADRQLFAAHLLACARCADEERLMRDVARGIASLRAAPDRAAAVDLGARPRPRRRRVLLLAAVAATAALLLVRLGTSRRSDDPQRARAGVHALEARVHQLEAQNALLARHVAREPGRPESPLAGIPIASPPNF